LHSFTQSTLKFLNKAWFTGFILFLFSSIFSVNALAIEFDEAFLNKIQAKYGANAKKRLMGWQKLIENNQDKTEKEKLEIVNNHFNIMRFLSDARLWRKEDYWATPLEFLVAGAGDCEDFSIAKYFTLLELNVPQEKLLITYVKAIHFNQAHMVLTYYEKPTSIPVVLDNLIGEIKPATKRKDLIPVYSFNGKGLGQAKQRGKGRKLGKSSAVKSWTDLETRMKEGEISQFNN